MKSKYLVFITFNAIVCCFIFLTNHLLVSDKLFFNTFAEQLTYEQIKKLISNSEKWELLGYVLVPLLVALKITLVATCLSIGLFFITNRFNFKDLFSAALVAEFVFLIPSLLKIIWFSFFKTDYDLIDLQLFYPLSALSLFDEAAVQQNQSWLVYPLQTLNLFEVAYWLLLAKGVSEVIKKDFTQSFELVMLESLGKIEVCAEGFSGTDNFFQDSDQINFNASLLLLLNIGEYTDRMSDELKVSYPSLPLQAVKGLRNLIAHHHTGIDFEMVFDIIKNDVPVIKKELSNLLAQEISQGTYDPGELGAARPSPFYKHVDFASFL